MGEPNILEAPAAPNILEAPAATWSIAGEGGIETIVSSLHILVGRGTNGNHQERYGNKPEW